jgi:hypothetical protein
MFERLQPKMAPRLSIYPYFSIIPKNCNSRFPEGNILAIEPGSGNASLPVNHFGYDAFQHFRYKWGACREIE